MYPPKHVCRQLYDLDPNLRLCWLGEDFEGTGEGCFGVVQLRARSRVESSEGKRRALEPLFPDDIKAAGHIFNKDGGAQRDFDSLTQAALLICTVSKQWNMHTKDVFGTRLLEVMKNARKTRKEHYKQQRREIEAEAKQTQDTASGIAAEYADGIMHARKHHAGERVVMARKHWKEHNAERQKQIARKNRKGIVKARLNEAGHR